MRKIEVSWSNLKKNNRNYFNIFEENWNTENSEDAENSTVRVRAKIEVIYPKKTISSSQKLSIFFPKNLLKNIKGLKK